MLRNTSDPFVVHWKRLCSLFVGSRDDSRESQGWRRQWLIVAIEGIWRSNAVRIPIHSILYDTTSIIILIERECPLTWMSGYHTKGIPKQMIGRSQRYCYFHVAKRSGEQRLVLFAFVTRLNVNTLGQTRPIDRGTRFKTNGLHEASNRMSSMNRE